MKLQKQHHSRTPPPSLPFPGPYSLRLPHPKKDRKRAGILILSFLAMKTPKTRFPHISPFQCSLEASQPQNSPEMRGSRDFELWVCISCCLGSLECGEFHMLGLACHAVWDLWKWANFNCWGLPVTLFGMIGIRCENSWLMHQNYAKALKDRCKN